MSRLTFIVVIFAAAISLPATAQTSKPSSASQGATQTAPAMKKASPVRPGGKSGAARVSQPLSSNLTAQECRKLGGKTETDDGGSCKYRMRCTITHANGDVYSSCIDELE